MHKKAFFFLLLCIFTAIEYLKIYGFYLKINAGKLGSNVVHWANLPICEHDSIYRVCREK